MPDPTEYHRTVKYRIQEYALPISGYCVNPLAGGRRIEVTGVCPACGGLTTTTWTYGSGNGYKGILRRSRSAPEPAEGARTVCCDCGYSHADRPDGAVFLGCGAYWQVELPGEH